MRTLVIVLALLLGATTTTWAETVRRDVASGRATEVNVIYITQSRNSCSPGPRPDMKVRR